MPPRGSSTRRGISANTWRAQAQPRNKHHGRDKYEGIDRGVPWPPRRRQLGGHAEAAEQRELEDVRGQHGVRHRNEAVGGEE
jgi:hypothetical protein